MLLSGGGEFVGSNYSNFGVIGETFVDFPVIGGDYETSIGFLYVASGIPVNITELFNDKTIKTGLFVKSLEISDAIGKSVYKSFLDNSNNLIRISLLDFKPSFHFIKLHTSKGVITKKIIIQR